MNPMIAVLIVLALVSVVVVLLERTHRRTAGLPRAPFGADLEGNVDLDRIQHDLDIARR